MYIRRFNRPLGIFAGILALAAAPACKKKEVEKPPEPAKTEPAKPPEPPKPPPDPNAPVDVHQPPADSTKTDSGLAWKILTPAPAENTEKPAATDTVKVHYTGWTTDGRKFDSSVDRGVPAQFPLNQVIPGWTEGLQLMAKGEKRRFWIPGNLAYGDPPSRPGAPPGMLVFDVELVDIFKAPEVPEDVADVPKNARRTKSGLAYRVLKKGKGKEKPKAESKVEVHYTGWTTDGKMFDSSVARGQTATFPLNGVIPGWTEGLQLMRVGEKTRFWIPGKLAYGDTPSRAGAPAGTLVFDVELIAIR